MSFFPCDDVCVCVVRVSVWLLVCVLAYVCVVVYVWCVLGRFQRQGECTAKTFGWQVPYYWMLAVADWASFTFWNCLTIRGRVVNIRRGAVTQYHINQPSGVWGFPFPASPEPAIKSLPLILCQGGA